MFGALCVCGFFFFFFFQLVLITKGGVNMERIAFLRHTQVTDLRVVLRHRDSGSFTADFNTS